MATAMENSRAALLGAAAASVVLVTVYEGAVRVQHEGGAPGVELNAGEQSRFPVPSPATTASPPPPSHPAALAHAVDPKPVDMTSAPPAALRARIAELEAQVAKLSAAKDNEPRPPNPFGKVRGFTPDELRDMAKKCELRMGFPSYGATPPVFDPDEARKLSLPVSETEQVNQILAAQNAEYIRSMREVYLAATGDTAGADQLDIGAMMNEILDKSPPAQAAAARQELALENAGLAKAPANPASEPAVARMLRLQNSASAKLNDALAASLGHADAERLLDAATPIHMVLAGCPSDKQ